MMNQWDKYYDCPSVPLDIFVTNEGSICIDYGATGILFTILIKEDGEIAFIQDGCVFKGALPPAQFGRLRESVGAEQEKLNAS